MGFFISITREEFSYEGEGNERKTWFRNDATSHDGGKKSFTCHTWKLIMIGRAQKTIITRLLGLRLEYRVAKSG